MPAKSQAQRKWAFGVKGARWAREHHFDTPGPLPKRAKSVKKKTKTKAKKKTAKPKAKKKRGYAAKMLGRY